STPPTPHRSSPSRCQPEVDRRASYAPGIPPRSWSPGVFTSFYPKTQAKRELLLLKTPITRGGCFPGGGYTSLPSGTTATRTIKWSSSPYSRTQRAGDAVFRLCHSPYSTATSMSRHDRKRVGSELEPLAFSYGDRSQSVF